MRARPKSCLVCGVRVESGSGRCPEHAAGGLRARPCLVCGVAVMGGNYCPGHVPALDEATRLARNPYRRAYRVPAYARARQHRFERARGRCESCGITLDPGLWDCHHVVEVRDGGTHDITNLRVLCRPCHRQVTAAARAARRRS